VACFSYTSQIAQSTIPDVLVYLGLCVNKPLRKFT
jgi:hypothetical protein